MGDTFDKWLSRGAYVLLITVMTFGGFEFWGQRRSSASEHATAIAAQTADETASDDPDAATTVYVTKSGKKYHRAGCRHLSKSKIAIELDKAKKSYSPCSVCKPPQ